MSTPPAVGRELTSMLRIISELGRHDVSIATAQILLQVAIRTSDNISPKPSSPSEIARWLGMSVSGVSRLMAKLASSEGHNLLIVTKIRIGNRAEQYVLSERGAQLIENIRSKLDDIRSPSSTHFESGEKSVERIISNKSHIKLRRVKWDDKELKLTVVPIEDLLSEEVQEWGRTFLSAPLTPAKVTAQGAVLQFVHIGDAVYFALRWCDGASNTTHENKML